MDWSRRHLLASSAGFLSLGARAAPPVRTPPRYLITVLAEGGWDVTLALDPKLGLSTVDGPEIDATGVGDDVEAVQTFGGIDIVVNNAKRPRITDFFSRWHSHSHMVRGIWMGAIPHDPCRFRLLTGTIHPTKPDVPTIVGYTHGAEEPLGTLDLSGWSLSGSLAASSGRIGYQSQIKAIIDEAAVIPPPKGAPFDYPLFRMGEAERDDVSRFLMRRAATYGGAHSDQGHNDQRISDLLQSWDRSERFREQAAAFVSELPDNEKPDLGTQVALTVDMLQFGLCRTVSLVTTNRWDTHINNYVQHAQFNDLFDKLDLLATELDLRGMLDETLVVVYSEMSRTPQINAGLGKDHWPHTTALLFGGGVRGSAVSGKTNEIVESTPMDLQTGEPDASGTILRYDHLAAGLLQWMDIDSERWLPGITPFRGLGS